MSKKLVEISRFSTSAEAAIALAHLEREGIPGELASETSATWFSHLGTSAIGVRLLVEETEKDLALRVIDSVFDTNDEEGSEAIDYGDPTEEAETFNSRREVPDELMRAWRAACLGLALPPLLSLLCRRSHHSNDFDFGL